MKIYIIQLVALLSIIFCDGNSADFDDNDSAGVSDRLTNTPPIIDRLLIERPRPLYHIPIPDTIDVQNITTIFITYNDRFLRKDNEENTKPFPLFNKTNFLADFLYDTHMANQNGYVRVIVHPHASANALIYVAEQINICEKRVEKNSFRTLGISKKDIVSIKRHDMTLYNRIIKTAYRAFIWFELWDEKIELETDNVSLLPPGGDSVSSMEIDFPKIRSDDFYQLPTALPSDTMKPEGNIYVYIWEKDSIIVAFEEVLMVRMDGQDTVIKRAHREPWRISNVNAILNYGHTRCPGCPMLFYLNQRLDFENIWRIMTSLHRADEGVIYFGVIPRGTYPPMRFPESTLAVRLGIAYYLARPTIIR